MLPPSLILLLACAFSALCATDVVFCHLCVLFFLQSIFQFIHFNPPSPTSPPVAPHYVLSALIFRSLFLKLIPVPVCTLSGLIPSFLIPSSPHIFRPSSSLTPFIFPLVISFPLLFSVSVEPLRLHRYSDCWLCRGGGMLFRHSTWRYCMTCTSLHSIKTTTINHSLEWITLTFIVLCLNIS